MHLGSSVNCCILPSYRRVLSLIKISRSLKRGRACIDARSSIRRLTRLNGVLYYRQVII